jgi:hypothetical protein
MYQNPTHHHGGQHQRRDQEHEDPLHLPRHLLATSCFSSGVRSALALHWQTGIRLAVGRRFLGLRWGGWGNRVGRTDDAVSPGGGWRSLEYQNGAAFDVYVWAPRVSQPEGGGDAPTQDEQAASWRGPGKKDSESGHASQILNDRPPRARRVSKVVALAPTHLLRRTEFSAAEHGSLLGRCDPGPAPPAGIVTPLPSPKMPTDLFFGGSADMDKEKVSNNRPLYPHAATEERGYQTRHPRLRKPSHPSLWSGIGARVDEDRSAESDLRRRHVYCASSHRSSLRHAKPYTLNPSPDL